ncbi:MAG: hypothetical protein L6R41_000239 [Letrouitia leprolyta]|nr:MAG: hypothetical protein L6R41_000239 [Letrouitia leprolyta]
MASTHASLDAAATERKARLAKLKSLKRKQPDTPTNDSTESTPGSTHILDSDQPSSQLSETKNYLSGRNYDPEIRGPKLGFESAPTANNETLEDRAEQIARETREQEEKEEKDERPIDLFKLQPKKPNWDLKRDLARKTETLNVRTDNAIARLVRERIETSKKKSVQHVGSEGGEQLGMEGEELVEGVHMREREEVEDEQKEREYIQALE